MTPEDTIGSLSLREKITQAVGKSEPLSIDGQDVVSLRSELKNAGVEFGIEVVERESLVSGNQFRMKPDDDGNLLIFDWTKPEGNRWVSYKEDLPDQYHVSPSGRFVDRGMGLVATLGLRKTGSLVGWCQAESKASGAPGIKGLKNTEGRGLQQVAADFICLALVEEEEISNVVDKINERLWKGLYRVTSEENRGSLNEKFGRDESEKPSSKVSSIVPELLPKLLDKITENADSKN